MAAVKVEQFWTAIVSLLRTFLSFLGFRATTERTSVPVSAPVAAPPRPRVPVQRTALAVVRERALPPTIEQRIRAEAHGTSPSVRCLPGAPAAPAAPAAGAAAGL